MEIELFIALEGPEIMEIAFSIFLKVRGVDSRTYRSTRRRFLLSIPVVERPKNVLEGILFNHRSFEKKNSRFPWVSGGFLEIRVPGKNGNGSELPLEKREATAHVQTR